MHSYDWFGWYAGDAYPDRDSGIEPPMLSVDAAPGVLRAYWTGREWDVRAFEPPPELADPRPAVPMEVTIAQALTAAHDAGLLEGLLAWVAAQPVVRQLQFERILTVRRDSPLLLEGVTALGLSDAQVDALFIAADQVVI